MANLTKKSNIPTANFSNSQFKNFIQKVCPVSPKGTYMSHKVCPVSPNGTYMSHKVCPVGPNGTYMSYSLWDVNAPLGLKRLVYQ